MSKGKTYEKRLVRRLREHGWTAERVPRSICDAQPTNIDDVVVVPGGVPTADHKDRPITRAIQSGDLPAIVVDKIEVKYTSTGGYGINGLYNTHLETVGLGGRRAVQWSSGHLSGGLRAWTEFCERYDPAEPFFGGPYRVDDTLAKSAARLFDETVTAVALKAPRKPWVVIWREPVGGRG